MADSFSTERTFERFQKDFPHWTINVRDPLELFRRQPTYTLSQVYCIVGALVCLLHALVRGGRWPFLWLASTLTGVLIEACVYVSPHETIWFSPTAIDLFGQRLPFFVLFAYPFFYYQAFWAASKLQLKCRWSEHIAMGLLVVLSDLPFDLVSIKFLHWTLHETEPLLADRFLTAPCMLLLFFAVCPFAFSYLFRNLREWFGHKTPTARGTIGMELLAVVGAASLSIPLGTGLLVALGALHTLLAIPLKAVVVGVFLCVATVFWKFDRKSNRRLPIQQDIIDHLLNGCVVVHFWLYLAMAALLNPEDVRSPGRRQPIGGGDCMDQETFLCLDTFDNRTVDFHCLPKPPTEGSYWYTVCGTVFENRAEFLFVLAIIAVLASAIHYTVHYDYDVRFKVYEFVRKPAASPAGKGKKVK